MGLMRRQGASSWNPFRELEEMMDRMNRGLPVQSAQGEREQLALADWTPRVNIKETERDYTIDAELPRVNKEDVKVSVEEGVLTIEGERKLRKEEGGEGTKFHRVETTYGSFMRRFTLPQDADDERLDATFKDGVLEVKIPKTRERKPRSRQVALK